MSGPVRPRSPAPTPLPPGTAIAQASINVQSLERTFRFYSSILGLDEVDGTPNGVWLGMGDTPLLELVHTPDAPRTLGAPRLFHLALLYPTRTDLAAVVHRLTGLGAPLQGASDHGVSEAVYLADPEGNGLEVYRDRTPDEWPTDDGLLAMQTLPLDLEGLLSEAPDSETWRTPPTTRIGHVHLRVSNVPEAESFYRDVIGLDLMQRYGESASFFSAGGYHHHVAVNTWGTLGSDAPPEGALGLGWFSLDVEDSSARQGLVERLRSQQIPHTVADGTVYTTDPSGNEVRM